MPLSYLQRDQPGDRTRFTDLSSVTFTIDATGPFASGDFVQWSALYLLFCSGDYDLEWRVWSAATMAGLSSPTFDTGLMAWPSAFDRRAFPRPHLRLFLDALLSAPFSAPRTEPCIRVEIYNTGNPAGYLDVGRLVLADAKNFQCIAYPQGLPYPTEDEREVVAESGASFARGAGIKPAAPFAAYLAGNTDEEKLAARNDFYWRIQGIQNICGASRPVLYDANPFEALHAQNGIVYGRLKGASAPSYAFQSTYTVELTIGGMR